MKRPYLIRKGKAWMAHGLKRSATGQSPKKGDEAVKRMTATKTKRTQMLGKGRTGMEKGNNTNPVLTHRHGIVRLPSTEAGGGTCAARLDVLETTTIGTPRACRRGPGARGRVSAGSGAERGLVSGAAGMGEARE